MAMNFNHNNNPISSFGLALSDTPFLRSTSSSSSSSNFGFHAQIPRARTYGIDQVRMIEDRMVTVAVPVPGSDFTVTEVVRTTRFVTPTSTMDRLLRFPASDNQAAGFSTGGISKNSIVQPHVRNKQLDQVRNPILSINHDTMIGLRVKKEAIFPNPLFGNVKKEPVSFNPSSSKRRRGLSIDLNQSDHNMDHESSVRPVDVVPKVYDTNVNSVECDGRTHSLPNYPEGTYACPTCMATFNSSQKFANHVKVHYSKESQEQKKRRLDAKYKRKKQFRVLTSDYGLSVVIDEATNRRKIVKLGSGLSSHEAASMELFRHGVHH